MVLISSISGQCVVKLSVNIVLWNSGVQWPVGETSWAAIVLPHRSPSASDYVSATCASLGLENILQCIVYMLNNTVQHFYYKNRHNNENCTVELSWAKNQAVVPKEHYDGCTPCLNHTDLCDVMLYYRKSTMWYCPKLQLQNNILWIIIWLSWPPKHYP